MIKGYKCDSCNKFIKDLEDCYTLTLLRRNQSVVTTQKRHYCETCSKKLDNLLNEFEE